jgi:hypothetical protein
MMAAFASFLLIAGCYSRERAEVARANAGHESSTGDDNADLARMHGMTTPSQTAATGRQTSPRLVFVPSPPRLERELQKEVAPHPRDPLPTAKQTPPQQPHEQQDPALEGLPISYWLKELKATLRR